LIISHSLLLFGLLPICGGCFGPPDLPSDLEVVLPGDARQQAEAGSGAELLENSNWSAFRGDSTTEESPEEAPPPGPYGGLLNGGILERVPPGSLMYRVHFIEGGRADRITENAFYLPELFGTDFIIDGAFHPARFPGLSYAAASFGVSNDDRFGIALPVEIRFWGIPLGTAVVYAWGTATADRLDGTFGYATDLEPLPRLLLGSGGDQYRFFAMRDP
jgi:hypothetical protein